MSDIFQHNDNKNRIAKNIADSYSEATPIESVVQQTQTPFEHQRLIKAQIANSFNTENALSSEELEKSADDFLEKGGKRAVIGEKRMFGGREYIKTAQGWKFHGKGTGEKAKGHAAGALDHHVEAGKGSSEKKPLPFKTIEELEDASNKIFYSDALKQSKNKKVGQSDFQLANKIFKEKYGMSEKDMRKKIQEQEPGIVGKPDTITLDRDHKKEDQKQSSATDSFANMDKKKVDDAISLAGRLVAEGASPDSISHARMEAKRLGQQSGMSNKDIDQAISDAKSNHQGDSKSTSKHIGDMSATDMKAAADKLGIDVKGKSIKQVRKELTDANIDKQITEFQSKKKFSSAEELADFVSESSKGHEVLNDILDDGETAYWLLYDDYMLKTPEGKSLKKDGYSEGDVVRRLQDDGDYHDEASDHAFKKLFAKIKKTGK